MEKSSGSRIENPKKENDGNLKTQNENNKNNNGMTVTSKNIYQQRYLAVNVYDCLFQCPPKQIAFQKVYGSLTGYALQISYLFGVGQLIQLRGDKQIIKMHIITLNINIDDDKKQCNGVSNIVLFCHNLFKQFYSISLTCHSSQYFNLQSDKCEDECKIFDSNGQFCLLIKKECNKFISIDQKNVDKVVVLISMQILVKIQDSFYTLQVAQQEIFITK